MTIPSVIVKNHGYRATTFKPRPSFKPNIKFKLQLARKSMLLVSLSKERLVMLDISEWMKLQNISKSMNFTLSSP